MTTAEIKALLERAKDEVEDCSETQCDLMAAVHILLARQAEVLGLAQPPSFGDLVELGGWLEVATNRLDAIRAVLSPETTSIRDTAAAHGFDAMPADIAQRSVDGETNYVRLNPEASHANHH